MTKTLDDAYHGLLPFDQDQISQAYLSYLQNGLPTSQAQAKNILIVGCGISGMVSATLLRQAGHNVTIVEANTRVGGRVKTFRNTNDKTYFEDSNLTGEAGAMRIPDMHKLVQYLIDQTGVDKQLFLTQQPPTKVGGLVLWTESPDTGQRPVVVNFQS